MNNFQLFQLFMSITCWMKSDTHHHGTETCIPCTISIFTMFSFYALKNSLCPGNVMMIFYLPDTKCASTLASTNCTMWAREARVRPAAVISGRRRIEVGDDWSHCKSAVSTYWEHLLAGFRLFKAARTSEHSVNASWCWLLGSVAERYLCPINRKPSNWLENGQNAIKRPLEIPVLNWGLGLSYMC